MYKLLLVVFAIIAVASAQYIATPYTYGYSGLYRSAYYGTYPYGYTYGYAAPFYSWPYYK